MREVRGADTLGVMQGSSGVGDEWCKRGVVHFSSVCHVIAAPRCCCLLHVYISALCRHHTLLLVIPALLVL